MTHPVIGWWHFDAERIAMVHVKTGQSVRYIGAASPHPNVPLTNSVNRHWMCFDYEDRETRYPLLVEWRNVPGVSAPRSWDVEPARMMRELERVIRGRSRLVTRDGTQTLVCLPQREGDPQMYVRHPICRSRVLYVDNDFVTDARLATVGNEGGIDPIACTFTERVGDIGWRHRADGRPIETVQLRSGGIDHLWHRPPGWAGLRLVDSLIDAQLSHPQFGVNFTAKSDDGMAVFAKSVPELLRLFVPTAGMLSDNLMYAATSLRESNERSRNSITTQFFDEEQDGIVRVATSVKTIGFWSYDPETRSLINQQSDQRLSFTESHALDGSETTRPVWGGEKSFLFVYRDRENEYPLSIRSKEVSRPSGLDCIWSVDHVASAALWRDQRQKAQMPGYGLWRRVDSCALDAAFCWPELDITGPVPRYVELRGGWFNRHWSNRLHRSAERVQENAFNCPHGPAVAPFIEALDADAPVWNFVDTFDFAAQADLVGVREIEHDRYFLPHDSQLAGFDRMPHLLRGDGKAVIFPAGCSGKPGRHGQMSLWFLYADEEVFFFFAVDPGFRQWELRLDSLQCFGLRDESRFDPDQSDGLPVDLFVKLPSRHVFQGKVLMTSDPSPSVMHRLTVAVLDAGLLWQRKDGLLSEVPERLLRKYPRGYGDPSEWEKIGLVPVQTIVARGGYVGGLFNWSYRLSAKLATDNE